MIIINAIHQNNISLLCLYINSLFSHAMYQIVISHRFHIHAHNHVYMKNLLKFILNAHAGKLINCLTTVINLARNIVTIQCFKKYDSAFK